MPARKAFQLMSIATAATLTGCGDDRNYPDDFAARAAMDEKAYVAAEAARAAAAPTMAPSSQAAAPAPLAPVASADDAQRIEESSGARSEDARGSAPDGSEETAGGADPNDPDPRVVEQVAQELGLPTPPAVPEKPGDASYQKLARDRKFDEFRRMAARYVQLKRSLLPYGEKLAQGVATPEERALHNRIEDAMAVEYPRLNRYIWQDRWTDDDRAAMGWIMSVQPD
jgi:hypothetical protein